MAEFVDLARVDRIGLDTETTGVTYDDRPVGISVSLPDGTDHYYRWGHEMGGNNCSKREVLRWVKREVNRSGLTVFMHSAGFDLRMLAYELGHEHPFPRARVEETGFMAALLNELEPDLTLDGLGQRHVGMEKEGDELWDFCSEAFGGGATRKAQAKNIWRAHGDVVEPYAKRDSRITLGLGDHLGPLLGEEGLADVYEMELQLIPILLRMHMVGVPVDVNKALALKEKLGRLLTRAERRWESEYGDVSYTSTPQIATLFDKLGLPYKRNEPTEKMLERGLTEGNASITKDDLEYVQHPVAEAITQMKKLKHFKGTFIDNYILANVDPNGVIHGEFHPLRNPRYGTRSGRFSSGGGLNLQNVPARDEEWAPLIRGLYVPASRTQVWGKADYSQIEFRYLAHYAGGELARAYNEDPDIDFHQMCAELVGIPRRPAKNINFGIVYGMGKKLMAAKLGLSLGEAATLLEEYHARLPEVSRLYNRADRRANQRGYIVTWGGRKRRFEKRGRGYAHTHKALNALLQGSAADLMKKAMISVADGLDWEATPMHLTVHDELDFSVPREKRARARFGKVLREKMEDFELRVPVVVDIEFGKDWGHVKPAEEGTWMKRRADRPRRAGA